MKCTRLPTGGIACGPDSVGQSVQVNGKTVYFDFDRRFGPLLTDKNGEPLKRQPVSENHPFWAPFNVWFKEWDAKHPEPVAPPHPSDKFDRRGSKG